MDEKHKELGELYARTGMRTVPQIFAGEELIGGYDKLSQLESQGRLRDVFADK